MLIIHNFNVKSNIINCILYLLLLMILVKIFTNTHLVDLLFRLKINEIFINFDDKAKIGLVNNDDIVFKKVSNSSNLKITDNFVEISDETYLKLNKGYVNDTLYLGREIGYDNSETNVKLDLFNYEDTSLKLSSYFSDVNDSNEYYIKTIKNSTESYFAISSGDINVFTIKDNNITADYDSGVSGTTRQLNISLSTKVDTHTLVISSNDNVGINKTNPNSNYKLDVGGNLNIDGIATISSNLTITSNLTVGSNIYFSGDLYKNGNLYTSYTDEDTKILLNTGIGKSNIVFENARIKEEANHLIINTNINYSNIILKDDKIFLNYNK